MINSNTLKTYAGWNVNEIYWKRPGDICCRLIQVLLPLSRQLGQASSLGVEVRVRKSKGISSYTDRHSCWNIIKRQQKPVDLFIYSLRDEEQDEVVTNV
jgi:hypothetical protein